MYNFEDILERHNNGSKKWNPEYIEKRFKIKDAAEYFPLFIADMDFKLPTEIIQPTIELISQGDFGYFDVKKCFYDSVVNWYKERYNCEIDSEWIVPAIGALATMNVIIEKLFEKGDKMLIFTPVYGPFKDVINNNGLELISSRLLFEENTYKIDFENLKKQIKEEDVKGIILCNPHNPSGICWSKDDLEEIINICKERNITIISDEVHGDLVLENYEFNSLSKYLNEYKKIIVISSPNKTFNIAGLDISTFLCSEYEVRRILVDEFNKRKLHPNRIGCEVLTICYKNGHAWVDDLRENIKDNIDLVMEMIKHEDVTIVRPHAGYLLWVKLNKVDDIEDFIIRLAKETGVLLETGNRFIKDNTGFLRINVATNKELLKEAINRFLDFYGKYKNELKKES